MAAQDSNDQHTTVQGVQKYRALLADRVRQTSIDSTAVMAVQ
jgi:hypothetical protein